MTLAFAPSFSSVSTATAPRAEGAAQGAPRVLLRLEGAAMLLAGLLAYGHLSGRWGLFALCFLLPDLSMLGYLAGPRAGAALYNAGHSYVGPALLAALGLWAPAPALLCAAALWAAHVGFDRMMGYGLKYPTAFVDTHLGRVGRATA